MKSLAEILTMYEEEHDNIEIVEDGDWEQDHKYQFCSTIIKCDDRFFRVDQSRSGSYHTDYEYNGPVVTEVSKKERVITQVYWEDL